MEKTATNKILKYIQSVNPDKAEQLVSRLHSMNALPEGKFIKNLGEGAEGVVDLVTYNKAPNGLAAKKYFNPKGTYFSDKELQKKENLLNALQDNSHMVNLYHASQTHPIHYLEYVKGTEPTTDDIFSANKAIMSIVKDMKAKNLSGLSDVDYAHNILRTPEGHMKVIDFLSPTITKKDLTNVYKKYFENSHIPKDNLQKTLLEIHYKTAVTPEQIFSDRKLRKKYKDIKDNTLSLPMAQFDSKFKHVDNLDAEVASLNYPRFVSNFMRFNNDNRKKVISRALNYIRTKEH